jgi:tetratricopeptide (TPR) repeat protein
MAQTQMGLGQVEVRQRSRTPAGLGAPPPTTDQSVAIPLPGRDARAAIVVPPPTRADEQTVRRRVTHELVELAKRAEDELDAELDLTHAADGPAREALIAASARSFDDDEEQTGVRSRDDDLNVVTKAMGAPVEPAPMSAPVDSAPVDSSSATTLRPAAPHPVVEAELARRLTAEAKAIHAAAAADSTRGASRPEDKPTAVLSKEESRALVNATAGRAAPEPEPAANRRGEAPRQASQPLEEPRAVEAELDGSKPSPMEVAVASGAAARANAADSQRPSQAEEVFVGRSSSETPAPETPVVASPSAARASRASIAERYSLTGEETVSDRRTSEVHSRRASGTTRLVVGLLVGGALIFLGVLAVQRFVAPSATTTAPVADDRASQLLASGEKALRDGDLDAAKTGFDQASALAPSDPRVARALARLAVIRADASWLELRLVPSDDPERVAVEKSQRDTLELANQAVDRALALGASDPEVARIQMDLLRIRGDLLGARALVERVASLSAQGETSLALGALDLAEQAPAWPGVIERLARAAEQEGQLGRARSMLIYAYARSGDGARARQELERLAERPRTHPLEGRLRKLVDASPRSEPSAVAADGLPSASPSGSGAAPVGEGSSLDSLTAAAEALRAGQTRKAEEIYQRLHDREPNNTEALAGLAAVARANGSTARAMMLYQRVLDQNPNYVPAILALADLKWSGGDRGAAAALYRRALQMGISGANAERARERSGASDPAPGPTSTEPTSAPTAAPTAPEDPYSPPSPTPPSTGGAFIEGEPADLPKPVPAPAPPEAP